MLIHLTLAMLYVVERSSWTYLCSGRKGVGHRISFEVDCTDRRRGISFAVWDHWRWLIVPQGRKDAACVFPGDPRGPGAGCVPQHVAGGAEGHSGILETVRPVQMDVCDPGEHGRSTVELRKVESGMARIGEEDWTTFRSF